MKIRRSIQLSALTLTAIMLCGCPSSTNTPSTISLQQLGPDEWTVIFKNTSTASITGFSSPVITDAAGIQEGQVTNNPSMPYCTSNTTLPPASSCYYQFNVATQKPVGITTTGSITLSANLSSGGQLTAVLPTARDAVLYAANSSGNIYMWDGSSWGLVGTSGLYNVTSIAVNTNRYNQLYAGTNSAGNNSDVNKWDGEEWGIVGSNPPEKVNAIIVPLKGNSTTYVGTSGNTSNVYKYSSVNGSLVWSQAGNNNVTGSVTALATDASDNGSSYNVFAATTNNVQELDRSTGTWTPIGTDGGPDAAISLAYSATRNRLYAVTNNGGNVKSSPIPNNGAQSWVTNYNPNSDTVTTLTYDATNDILYVGSALGVGSLTGSDYTPLDNGGRQVNVSAMVVDPSSSALYVGLNNNGTNNPNIQRWNGQIWNNVGITNVPRYVIALAIGNTLNIQAP
jgi:hypothetical protein